MVVFLIDKDIFAIWIFNWTLNGYLFRCLNLESTWKFSICLLRPKGWFSSTFKLAWSSKLEIINIPTRINNLPKIKCLCKVYNCSWKLRYIAPLVTKMILTNYIFIMTLDLTIFQFVRWIALLFVLYLCNKVGIWS